MAFNDKYTISVNYPTSSVNEPRWGHGKPQHQLLREIFERGRDRYAELLRRFVDLGGKYLTIEAWQDNRRPWEPSLNNPWLPGLDSLALYCELAILDPVRYVEVGSGSSTKFAGRSIRDNTLRTEITSIDPEPRAEIDAICDHILRSPLEQIEHSFFETLAINDILFFDGSHRCFMNSDVTVMFLDILPRLKPGVVVQIHDIYLPDDYPPWWAERYYSEQYLLAAYILAQGQKFDILLPNRFVAQDPQLLGIVKPILDASEMGEERKVGGSFWLVTK